MSLNFLYLKIEEFIYRKIYSLTKFPFFTRLSLPSFWQSSVFSMNLLGVQSLCFSVLLWINRLFENKAQLLICFAKIVRPKVISYSHTSKHMHTKKKASKMYFKSQHHSKVPWELYSLSGLQKNWVIYSRKQYCIKPELTLGGTQ